MPATHTLDAKIQALNLLDRHDGDFKLVKSRLGISINALRSWLADEKQLRMQYDNRQWRYFGNLKYILLQDVLEGAVSTMEKFKAGDYEHSSPSQQAYIVATLVGLSRHLETSFEAMESMSQSATEQPNKMRFISEDDLAAKPLPAAANPPQPAPSQSTDVPAAWKKSLRMETARDPERDALVTAVLRPYGTELPDDLLDMLRAAKESEEAENAPAKPKRKMSQTHRKRRKRRRKRR